MGKTALTWACDLDPLTANIQTPDSRRKHHAFMHHGGDMLRARSRTSRTHDAPHARQADTRDDSRRRAFLR